MWLEPPQDSQFFIASIRSSLLHRPGLLDGLPPWVLVNSPFQQEIHNTPLPFWLAKGERSPYRMIRRDRSGKRFFCPSIQSGGVASWRGIRLGETSATRPIPGAEVYLQLSASTGALPDVTMWDFQPSSRAVRDNLANLPLLQEPVFTVPLAPNSPGAEAVCAKEGTAWEQISSIGPGSVRFRRASLHLIETRRRFHPDGQEIAFSWQSLLQIDLVQANGRRV